MQQGIPQIDVLAGLELFSSLTGQQRKKLAALCVVKPAEKGALLFSEGETAHGLYVMLTGKVKIFRVGPDGREVVLHVFGVGEMFGEVAVFQGRAFPANAECLEAGRTLFLPRSALVDALAEDPSLAMGLLASLSRRLRGFVNKIESLTLMETPQRLAAYLLHFSEENGGVESFHLDVSKALLAGLLGTARETLSRCLARMVEQEYIALEGRKVRILDKEALRRMVRGVDSL